MSKHLRQLQKPDPQLRAVGASGACARHHRCGERSGQSCRASQSQLRILVAQCFHAVGIGVTGGQPDHGQRGTDGTAGPTAGDPGVVTAEPGQGYVRR